MANEVIVKQVREIRNPKGQMVATADVNIGAVIFKGFKILRTDRNTFWVANPQSEANGNFYEIVEFLDWELEQTVKEKILSAYQRLLQSRTVFSETTE